MIKLSRIINKVYRLVLSRGTLLFLFLLLTADIYLETIGLPKFAVSCIERNISESTIPCKLGAVCVGFWNGIVINDVDVVDGEEGYNVHIPNVIVRLKYLPLFCLRIDPARVYVRNAEIGFVERLSGRIINLENVNCSAELDYSGRLDMDASADWNGVALSFSSTLRNFNGLDSLYGLKKAFPVGGGLDEKQLKMLERTFDNLISSDFGFNDSFLEVTFDVDMNSPEQAVLSGIFSINDAFVSDILVSKLHGRFKYFDKAAEIKDILWLVGRNETVRGSINYDFEASSFYGHVSAALIPDTVFNIFGIEHTALSRYLDVRRPVLVSVDIPEPVSSDKIEVSAVCKVNDMSFMNMDIPEVSATVSYDMAKIAVRDMKLYFAKDGSEVLDGWVEYDISGKTLSCSVDGMVRIDKRLADLDIEVPGQMRDMLESPVRISVAMKDSPLCLEGAAADFTVTREEFDLLHWKVGRVALPIALRKGVVHCGNDDFEIYGSGGERANVSASLNLNESLKKGVFSIEHAVYLEKHQDEKVDMTASWKGVMTVDAEKRMMECRGTGTCFMDRFFNSYLRECNFSSGDFLSYFKCVDKPFSCEAVIEVPFDGKWKIEGTLRGDEGCGFGDLVGKSVSTAFVIDEKHIEFNELNAEFKSGEKVSMDVECHFMPFVFEISDMRFKGDPAQVEVFIFNDEAKEVYSSIWKGFEWEKGKSPNIDISLIRYYSDENSIHWNLDLNGVISAEDFKWNGEGISNGQAKIMLDLPRSLAVSDAVIKLGNAEIEGRGNVFFDGIPYANFIIDRADGEMNLRNIAIALNPAMETVLPDFSLGKNTHIECSGFFNLQKPLRPEVTGCLKTDKLSVMGIDVENVECDWKYVNSMMKINANKAELMGGSFSGGCSYDMNQQSGDFIGSCENLLLEDIIAALSKDEKKSYPGRISANCSLRYHFGWGGVPKRVDGMGHFSVTDADIWNVPVLKQLSSILDFANFKLFRRSGEESSSIGKITDAEANVMFLGDRIVMNDFKTNGTIVALEGGGTYLWNEDYVDFTVKSRILRKISILSLLFRPLSGAFDARMKGPRKTAKWDVRTYLGKMFSYEE